jgi:Ca-activated chloride channel family protein
MTFHARPDRHFIRTGYRSNRFVLVELTAPAQRSNHARPPVNISIVLDRSGSMGGQKLSLAKKAVDEALRALDERDRFSLVVYDDQIDVVMESTRASAEARETARRHLAGIDARGSTNLAEGWLRGCEQIARHQHAEGINRCLLITDGLANVGITDPAELEKHAAELRARRIVTSTFGIGADFNEFLLKGMSLQGGGNFSFIATATQIRDAITSEIGEVLDIVARDVKLLIGARKDVQIEPLNDFTCHRTPDGASIDLRDLVSEQRVEVVLRLNFPHGEIGESVAVSLELADGDAAFRVAKVDLAFEYADSRTNDLQPRDGDVDRRVAEQFAARAREASLEMNRAGDYQGANARLDAVARKIRSYAGSDTRLLRIADQLVGDQASYSAPMHMMAAKQAHFTSVNVRRSRDSSGKPIKS